MRCLSTAVGTGLCLLLTGAAQAVELDKVVAIFTIDSKRHATVLPPAAAAKGILGLQEQVKQAATSYLTRGNTAVKEDWSEF